MHYDGKDKLDMNNIPYWFMDVVNESDSVITIEPYGFNLTGFGKSGSADLVFVNGEWALFTRYGQADRVADLRDLLSVVMEWHEISKERHSGWNNPPYEWSKLLLKYNYIDKNPD